MTPAGEPEKYRFKAPQPLVVTNYCHHLHSRKTQTQGSARQPSMNTCWHIPLAQFPKSATLFCSWYENTPWPCAMPLQLCRVSYLVICIKYDITQTHQEQVQGKRPQPEKARKESWPWTSMTGTQVILMSNQCPSHPSQSFPALPSLIPWFFLKGVCLGAMTPEPEGSFYQWFTAWSTPITEDCPFALWTGQWEPLFNELLFGTGSVARMWLVFISQLPKKAEH